MPPRSRGNALPQGLQSKSTPDLTQPRPLDASEHAASEQTSHPTQGSLSPRQRAFPANRAAVDDDALDGEGDLSLMIEGSEDSGLEDSASELPAPRPLRTSRSQNNLPRHSPSMLFPPFYNRPPNPLPPSPSLTSLLRPTFSATTSRPTTPESSDIELPAGSGHAMSGGTSTRASSVNSNLASITKSARHAPTVPRASPKVPTYEYYGFAVYLGSSAAFLMYVLWAYLPSPLLHKMGIHYYPNRWWALAVPCWLVVLVIYIYVALASYNTKYLTLPLRSCENLVDECAQVAVVDRRTGQIVRDAEIGKGKSNGRGKDRDKGGKRSAPLGRRDSYSAYQFSAAEEPDWKSFWSTGTDAVMDVPIGGVCEILYGGD